jgi:tetratricopeptide (TPR) repeat protein
MFDLRSLFAAFRPRISPRGAYERAIEAHDAGRFAEALGLLEAAEHEGAVPAATLLNKRGVVLVALGRREDALRSFCDALAADEKSAPALVNLGNLLFEDGHALDAVDYYEAALRADESYAPAYRNLAVALKRLGRHDGTVRALRSAARLEHRQRRRG